MATYNLTNGQKYTFSNVNGAAACIQGTDNATEKRNFAKGINVSGSNLVYGDNHLHVGRIPSNGFTANEGPLASFATNNNTVAAETNLFRDFQILLHNESTVQNSFTGICFVNGTNTAISERIGAAIRGERDNTNSALCDTNLTFATNDNSTDDLYERMRITHDGYVGIGTTSPTRMLMVSKDKSGDYVAHFQNENTSTPHGIRIRCDKNNNTSTYIRFDRDGGNAVGSVSGDGDNTISYNESSDVRLKNNIRDCEFTIDDFDKIKIRSYEKSCDRTHHGVRAQEILEIPFSSMVSTGEEWNREHNLKEGDEEYAYMEVAYNKFIPMLVKSVQDANMMIKNLQQEVKDLKEKLNG